MTTDHPAPPEAATTNRKGGKFRFLSESLRQEALLAPPLRRLRAGAKARLSGGHEDSAASRPPDSGAAPRPNR